MNHKLNRIVAASVLLASTWHTQTRTLATANIWDLPHAVQISVGSDNACAVTAVGSLLCWGWNSQGQLGDGTTSNRRTPTPVVGLSSGVVAVSVASLHTCALLTGGGVKCWGYNSAGQLGDGTHTSSLVPVNVVSLTQGAVAISANGDHSCALLLTGGINCWGRNWFGQLGDGTTDDSAAPVNVIELGGEATSVSAGGYGRGLDFTCASLKNGAAKCWGFNDSGQLGNGTTSEQHIPYTVTGMSGDVRNVVAGVAHACATMLDGHAWCWGNNATGQLGDGTYANRLAPVEVVSLTGAIHMSAAGAFSCARVASGEVLCWGGNTLGQLGDGTWVGRTTPGTVLGLPLGTKSLDSDTGSTCVTLPSGDARCWGANFGGKLGDGTNQMTNVPVNVIGFGNVPYPTWLPLAGR